MSGNFDWQTEDDGRWEDVQPEANPPRGKRRRWLLGLLLLLVVASAAIYYQVDRRIDATVAAIEQDVVSSVNLIRRAAAERDAELLLSMLSGRDMTWAYQQRDLLDHDLLRNRAPFGLTAVDHAPIAFDREDDQSPVAITLSPELDTAVVTVDQPYTTIQPDGQPATVTLRETAVYRRGTNRWLLTDPDDEFWGNWVSDLDSGEPVDVIYRTRDEALVQRLRKDLIPIVAQICSALEGVTCPADQSLELRFVDDPAVLLATRQPLPVRVTLSSLQIDLPSPTLVGLPVDDAGYDALLRGYASQVAAATIAHIAGYDCCRHAAYFQATMAWQLASLGLSHWPVTAETYARQRAARVNLDDLNRLWNIATFDDIPRDDLWQVYIAVEFLRHSYPDISVFDVQRSLNQPRSFQRWLNELPRDVDETASSDTSDAVSRWAVFVYNGGPVAGETAPARPSQDLQLSCYSRLTRSETTELRRYNPQTRTLVSEEQLVNVLPYTSPLPDDSGTVILLYDQDAELFRVNSWVQGVAQLLRPASARFALTLGQPTGNGRGLVFYEVGDEPPDIGILSIDLGACDASGCAASPLPGVPTWSPDGSQVIYSAADMLPNSPIVTPVYTALFGTDVGMESPLRASMLVRAADDTAVTPDDFRDNPTVTGFAPFWLDDSTYGYVTLLDDLPYSELRLANAFTDEVHTVVDVAQLQEAVPADNSAILRTIAYARPNPTRPSQLAIVATSVSYRTAQVFLYDHQTGTLEWRLGVGLRANQALGFSPDGRFLVVTGTGSENIGLDGRGQILLHDLQANTTASFPIFSEPSLLAPFDWSADGQWLAFMLDDNILALVHPSQPYAEIGDVAGCTAPIWINRS